MSEELKPIPYTPPSAKLLELIAEIERANADVLIYGLGIYRATDDGKVVQIDPATFITKE